VKPIRAAAILASVVLASCASSTNKNSSTAAAPTESSGAKIRSADEWVSDISKDNGFVKGPDGRLVPKSDRRSPFENKGESYFAKKSYKKEQYKTGDFTTKSWWGNKGYDHKNYSGNTDGSRFEKSSGMQGKGARENGNAADIPDNYHTGTFATGNARESTDTRMHDSTSIARENDKDNSQFQWNPQRSLSVEQSRSLLGR
jgi:hypothetical protein